MRDAYETSGSSPPQLDQIGLRPPPRSVRTEPALAEASRRLRESRPAGLRRLPGRVGRPSKAVTDGARSGSAASETRVPSGSAPRPGVPLSPVPSRLLDVHQAAAYLGGVHPRTVRRLVERGELRRVHAPVRRFLVDRADLDRVIETWKA